MTLYYMIWGNSTLYQSAPNCPVMVADGRFQPFPVTRFGPWAPETGPNGVFAHETPQSYGKRVAWVHPSGHFSPLGQPALRAPAGQFCGDKRK